MTKSEIADRIIEVSKKLDENAEIDKSNLLDSNKVPALKKILKSQEAKLSESKEDEPKKPADSKKDKGQTTQISKIDVSEKSVTIKYDDNSSEKVSFDKDVRNFLIELNRSCTNEIAMLKRPSPNDSAIENTRKRYYSECVKIGLKVNSIDSNSVRKLFETKTDRSELIDAVGLETLSKISDAVCDYNKLARFSS